MGPRISLCLRSSALVLALVAFVALPGFASAQDRVTTTLSRYDLERYFLDSLRTGDQRVIGPGGSVRKISDVNALTVRTLLPTRVGGEAVVGSASPGGDSRLILPDRAFAETDEGVGMFLVPVVIIEGGGLRYEDGRFRGSIRVGVEDSLQVSGSVDLPTPIRFFVSGDVDSIRAPDVQVGHTNLPFAPITLVQATTSGSVSLNVRTDLHPDGVDLEVPLVRGELPFDAAPRRIQGMGLEEARLTLGPVLSGEGVAVQLSATAGNLTNAQLRLSADGTTTSAIRSSWFGASTVTARSIPFEDSEVLVHFVFPWIFMLVSIVGGVAGGAAAAIQGKGDWARRVGLGALLGLIATVLYAVGVNLTPVTPAVTTGQAVVFGLAALIGYLGSLRVPGASGG